MAYSFTIYSMGNAKMLSQAFNGVAMIMDSSGTDSFDGVIKVGLVLFLILAGLKSAFTQKYELGQIFTAIILVYIFTVPKIDIVIEDTFTGSGIPVANVPLGIAAPMAMTSAIGMKVSEQFQTAFSLPGQFELGYLDPLQLINSLRRLEFKIADKDFSDSSDYSSISKSVGNYIMACVMPDLASDQLEVTSSAIENAQVSWDALKIPWTEVYFKRFLPGDDAAGTEVNCDDGWTSINDVINGSNSAGIAFNDRLSKAVIRAIGKDPATTSVSTLFANLQNTLGLVATDGEQFMRNSLVRNMFLQAKAGYYASTGDAASVVNETQAINQQASNWAAEKTVFQTFARPLMAFIELFVVAVTPVAAFLLCFGLSGVGLATKYLLMMVWISLWPPVMSLCNMYIYSVVSSKLADFDGALQSFNGMDTLYTTAAEWIATGGMLAASTPALTLMLLYGSATTAVSLAQRLSGRDHIDPKQTAPDLMKTAPVLSNESFLHRTNSTGVGHDSNATKQTALDIGSRANADLSTSRGATDASSVTLGNQLAHVVGHQDSRDLSNTVSTARDWASKSGIANEFGHITSGIIGKGNDLGLSSKHEAALNGLVALAASPGMDASTFKGIVAKLGAEMKLSSGESLSKASSDALSDRIYSAVQTSDAFKKYSGTESGRKEARQLLEKIASVASEADQQTLSTALQTMHSRESKEQASSAVSNYFGNHASYSVADMANLLASNRELFDYMLGQSSKQANVATVNNMLSNNPAIKGLNSTHAGISTSDLKKAVAAVFAVQKNPDTSGYEGMIGLIAGNAQYSTTPSSRLTGSPEAVFGQYGNGESPTGFNGRIPTSPTGINPENPQPTHVPTLTGGSTPPSSGTRGGGHGGPRGAGAHHSDSPKTVIPAQSGQKTSGFMPETNDANVLRNWFNNHESRNEGFPQLDPATPASHVAAQARAFDQFLHAKKDNKEANVSGDLAKDAPKFVNDVINNEKKMTEAVGEGLAHWANENKDALTKAALVYGAAKGGEMVMSAGISAGLNTAIKKVLQSKFGISGEAAGKLATKMAPKIMGKISASIVKKGATIAGGFAAGGAPGIILTAISAADTAKDVYEVIKEFKGDIADAKAGSMKPTPSVYSEKKDHGHLDKPTFFRRPKK